MKLCYYQLLDFRQGVRENLMKGQGVRVHIKVKNHWLRTSRSKQLSSQLCYAQSELLLLYVISSRNKHSSRIYVFYFYLFNQILCQ